jgi:hypothetical protein
MNKLYLQDPTSANGWKLASKKERRQLIILTYAFLVAPIAIIVCGVIFSI